MLSLGLGESKASMPTRMNSENYFRRATPMEDEDAESPELIRMLATKP